MWKIAFFLLTFILSNTLCAQAFQKGLTKYYVGSFEHVPPECYTKHGKLKRNSFCNDFLTNHLERLQDSLLLESNKMTRSKLFLEIADIYSLSSKFKTKENFYLKALNALYEYDCENELFLRGETGMLKYHIMEKIMNRFHEKYPSAFDKINHYIYPTTCLQGDYDNMYRIIKMTLAILLKHKHYKEAEEYLAGQIASIDFFFGLKPDNFIMHSYIELIKKNHSRSEIINNLEKLPDTFKMYDNRGYFYFGKHIIGCYIYRKDESFEELKSIALKKIYFDQLNQKLLE